MTEELRAVTAGPTGSLLLGLLIGEPMTPEEVERIVNEAFVRLTRSSRTISRHTRMGGRRNSPRAAPP